MRITFLELNDFKYPLSYSLYASEELSKIYKSDEQLTRLLESKKVPPAPKIAALANILAVLVKSGCEYYNELQKPIYEDAPVDEDGVFIPLTAKQLKLCISTEEDVKRVIHAIKGAQQTGQKKEIKAVPPKRKGSQKKRV